MSMTWEEKEAALVRLQEAHDQCMDAVIRLRASINKHHRYEEALYGERYADEMQKIRMYDLNALLQPIATIVNKANAEKLKGKGRYD
tara:strand:+ start:1631 stop:1891 length:261 start_codon:yes stop_codon:yes gene_type:complete